MEHVPEVMDRACGIGYRPIGDGVIKVGAVDGDPINTSEPETRIYSGQIIVLLVAVSGGIIHEGSGALLRNAIGNIGTVLVVVDSGFSSAVYGIEVEHL